MSSVSGTTVSEEAQRQKLHHQLSSHKLQRTEYESQEWEKRFTDLDLESIELREQASHSAETIAALTAELEGKEKELEEVNLTCETLSAENAILDDQVSVQISESSLEDATKTLVHTLEDKLREVELEVATLTRTVESDAEIISLMEQENELLSDTLESMSLKTCDEDVKAAMKLLEEEVLKKDEEMDQKDQELAALKQELATLKQLHSSPKSPRERERTSSASRRMQVKIQPRMPGKKKIKRMSVFAKALSLTRQESGKMKTLASCDETKSLVDITSKPTDEQKKEKLAPKTLSSGSPRVSLKKKKTSTKSKSRIGSKDNKYARDSAIRNAPAISNPSDLLQKSMRRMTNGNWRDEFAGLEDLRKVVIQQSQLLIPHYTTIIRALVIQLENLRSSIVKATLLCLSAIFVEIEQPILDKHLATLTSALIKRAADQNKFLQLTAINTCEQLVQCSSPTKLLKQLVAMDKGGTIIGSVVLKDKIAHFTCSTIEQAGDDIFSTKASGMLQDVVEVLGRMLYAKTTESRNSAKKAVSLIMSSAENCAAKATLSKIAKTMSSKTCERFLKEMQTYDDETF